LLAPLLLSLLPSQLTHLLLPRLTASFPALFPPSPRGSLIYARNYKLVFTLLVGSYVVWTFFVDGNVEEGEEWYSLLEVKRDVDDEALRKAFRRLSRTHHPDRAGISHSNKFIILRQAYETLSDPLTRYAYDRFGPQVISWKGKTVGDYLKRGLANASGFYL
ncbi:hypothetical protein TREMEDRAFT_19366, partial [Tremella mesenterica DSM 1558]|uniref:uncharacterized protein n=1 Tax=Tremella mesenterica (strain ATCC 24925 / CBS 8224 / DSM 1558 / NBRC 9311 / NRRL Y-6157 / RJB 2259-6 / UBC 559-6) TaxID=578456 RepID=UPI0003F4900B